jgi:AcrR family transcriptional regulator
MTVTRGETAGASTTRERVLRAAADLLAEGGRDAVSTRAVSAAAGVQAPTLYRLFGDKEGLLQAVAAHGFAEYLSDKHALAETDDPIDDSRRFRIVPAGVLRPHVRRHRARPRQPRANHRACCTGWCLASPRSGAWG